MLLATPEQRSGRHKNLKERLEENISEQLMLRITDKYRGAQKRGLEYFVLFKRAVEELS